MMDEYDFFNFAMKNYDNPNCRTVDEFKNDLLRFKHINKLLCRFENGDDVDIMLILNHFIILYNIFAADACTRMILYRCRNYLSAVKTFLTFLNYMPDNVPELGIINSDIELDARIVNGLRSTINGK